MLSSNPAIPLHSIKFTDDRRQGLSLVTAHGHEFYTAHDGLPSPEHLTPVTGTPAGSPPGSAASSRRPSQMDMTTGMEGHEDGLELHKTTSHRLGDVVS